MVGTERQTGENEWDETEVECYDANQRRFSHVVKFFDGDYETSHFVTTTSQISIIPMRRKHVSRDFSFTVM